MAVCHNKRKPSIFCRPGFGDISGTRQFISNYCAQINYQDFFIVTFIAF